MAQRRNIPLAVTPLAVTLLAALTLPLAACGNFFVYPGSSTTTTSTATDFVYATNSSAGTTSLNGFLVSSGTLVAATSSPFSLGFTPQSVVVSRANTFVYVASDSQLGNGAIYGYSIGTGGALTVLSSGTALVGENSAALETSPDGKYLFSLNASVVGNGTTLEQYSINTSTGALTFVVNYPVTNGSTTGTLVSTALAFAPSGNFLVAALGTGGAETFAYNTSTGALAATANITPPTTSLGIYGVTVDASNNIYCAGTSASNYNGLQTFSATTTGAPKSLASAATGNGPHSVVLNAAGTFVYVGNFTDGTISGYAIGTGGALTAVAGSPYNAPANVFALGRDKSGSYLIAAGYSAASGFQIYSIQSTGALTSSNTAASGTSTQIPVSLGTAH